MTSTLTHWPGWFIPSGNTGDGHGAIAPILTPPARASARYVPSGCERNMGPFGARNLVPALGQAGTGSRAQPSVAGRSRPGLRRLPARTAAARRPLGVVLALVARLPAPRRVGRRA